MTAIHTDDFAFFADFLRGRSAISIGPGKEYLVESRLAPVARDGGYRDISSLIEELRRPRPDAGVCDRVVQAMTTNETSFYRDVHPFEALRESLVPAAMTSNAGLRRLSVWSAACSTGQELYTIAMTLEENFPALSGWDVRLVGTDLSSDVVSRARQGSFSPLEVNRGLPASLLLKYFERVGRNYVIDARLRERCQFQELNLAGTWPVLPMFDIVFCRNVLIYFDMPVKRRILAKIRQRLVPGGVLVLGAAESALGLVEGFTQARVNNTVVYRAE